MRDCWLVVALQTKLGPHRMNLHGSIAQNLEAAIRSAERLRGHPVHPDTLQFWRDLLALGRAEVRKGAPTSDVEALLGKLEDELALRT